MEKSDSTNEKSLPVVIKELELQHKTVSNKLHHTESELKMEKQKKMFFESNIEELQELSEYYTNYADRFKKRIRKTENIHGQFEFAALCYERILANYSEDYINDSESEEENDVPMPEGTTAIQQEIADIQEKNDEQSGQIIELIDSLEVNNTD
ncbi:hypothetical protein JTB14_000677 [Gonioctena quinquepunctata]|nr:hypothetical protein JTB14_000677 [Gonioctena quinquepunctata]